MKWNWKFCPPRNFWHKFLAHQVFGDTFSARHTKSMAIPVVRNWWLSSVHNLAINNFRNTEWHGLHANRKQVNIRKLLLFGTFSTVWKWTKLGPNRPMESTVWAYHPIGISGCRLFISEPGTILLLRLLSNLSDLNKSNNVFKMLMKKLYLSGTLITWNKSSSFSNHEAQTNEWSEPINMIYFTQMESLNEHYFNIRSWNLRHLQYVNIIARKKIKKKISKKNKNWIFRTLIGR